MSQIDHIAGTTFHGRKGSVENAFSYGVDYVMFDPEAQLSTPGLFSRNGGNLLSLWDRDHGGAPKSGTGAAWVRQVLEAHGVGDLVTTLTLLAQPRVLGRGVQHLWRPAFLPLPPR